MLKKQIIVFLFLLMSIPSLSQKAYILEDFRLRLARPFEMYLTTAPEFDSLGKCYHYTELLKVEIGGKSRVTVELSDSAPEWLVNDLQTLKDKKRIDYTTLELIAKKQKLKNCTLVFPLILESDDIPCGSEVKRQRIPPNYFKFNDEQLNGRIIFGEEIKAVFPTRFIFKEK